MQRDAEAMHAKIKFDKATLSPREDQIIRAIVGIYATYLKDGTRSAPDQVGAAVVALMSEFFPDLNFRLEG